FRGGKLYPCQRMGCTAIHAGLFAALDVRQDIRQQVLLVEGMERGQQPAALKAARLVRGLKTRRLFFVSEHFSGFSNGALTRFAPAGRRLLFITVPPVGDFVDNRVVVR